MTAIMSSQGDRPHSNSQQNSDTQQERPFQPAGGRGQRVRRHDANVPCSGFSAAVRRSRCLISDRGPNTMQLDDAQMANAVAMVSTTVESYQL